MNLEERFYTSTEVAQILGVSLRSVYRYLEEDKIDAEVKTATGRHRFTKQNILDFLYPDQDKFPQKKKEPAKEAQSAPSEVVVAPVASQPIEPAIENVEAKDEAVVNNKAEDEDPVDWLSKFKAAAEKYKQEQSGQAQNVP